MKGGKDEKRSKMINPNFNEQEGSLCDKLNLSSHEYLIIKDLLIRESVKEGFVTKNFAENQIKLDKDRISGVFDFLVSRNLIISNN